MGNVAPEPQLYNADAERSVLGAILIDGDAIHRVTGLVKPADFRDERHGQMFAAMLSLAGNGGAVDQLTVYDLMDRRGLKPDSAYLSELVNATPWSLHAEHYAKTVAAYAARRRLLKVAGEIAQAACDTNSADPLADAHAALMTVGGTNGSGPRPVSEAASSLYDQVEYWAAHPLEPGGVRGLSSGVSGVDQLTGGMRPADLVLMAGRPAMGKSALAFEVGRRVAARRERVAIFSLEMSKEKIVQRWASAESRVDSKRIERGLCPDNLKGAASESAYASPKALAAYLQAIANVNTYPVEIDDSPGLTATEIRARALTVAQKGDLALAIVDHSGLIRSEGRRGENSAKTEGRKSQRMKELAKELKCPVLLVQQLSRATENRAKKQPTLADLRDSGEHEQNADIVLALYRDGYYNEHPAGSAKDLELEVRCLKHREGDTAFRRLRYERHLSRFTEFAV